MADRGILFSAPMVQRILAGKKDVTRRALGDEPIGLGMLRHWAPIPGREDWHCPWTAPEDAKVRASRAEFAIRCPYGQAGDRLWVREAWRTIADYDDRPKRAGVPVPVDSCVWYDADRACKGSGYEGVGDIGTGDSGHDGRGNWHTIGRYRHARFMPRWASRITLDVVSVRVERLHEITEEDAVREGCEGGPIEGERPGSAVDAFRVLWASINGAWTPDAWVWRVEFRRVSP